MYACIESGRHGCTLIIQCSAQSASWDQAICDWQLSQNGRLSFSFFPHTHPVQGDPRWVSSCSRVCAVATAVGRDGRRLTGFCPYWRDRDAIYRCEQISCCLPKAHPEGFRFYVDESTGRGKGMKRVRCCGVGSSTWW